ncbi:helix-turn-helix domain-containing protein [Desulfovibrio inopinatus]|uniref:helix-turn-helix domain-containing protein n=1 Tax=Desulfovibrio inopinatus TaxID=102109 RepID=UPI00146FA032|nr:DnaA/Hda family protein [Desulfovibrio inopinatus]
MKEHLRKFLKQSISQHELESWFDPLDIYLEDDSTLVVQFPHPHFEHWFNAGPRNRFENQAREILGPGFTIRYGFVGHDFPSSRASSPPKAASIDFPFGHRFTFESFYSNDKNAFPLASALQVAQSTDARFNPLVICGQGASGKTHLLRAIANVISKRVPASSMFVGTVLDLNEIIINLNNNSSRIRRHFADTSHIFVDEMERLVDFPDVQTELITLFNLFRDAGKQMVFSCLGKVAGYDFLDPALKSRLEWGLIVFLKNPDLDVRLRYIQADLKTRRIRLTKDQMLTLARQFTDFRLLQGILTKIAAFAEFVKKDIDEADFRQILSHTEQTPKPRVEAADIIAVTARHFNVSEAELLGNKRNKQIAMARQVAMTLSREILGLSYPVLGQLFGGKDHSTVLYSIRKIKKIEQESKEMKNLLNSLSLACQSKDQKTT